MRFSKASSLVAHSSFFCLSGVVRLRQQKTPGNERNVEWATSYGERMIIGPGLYVPQKVWLTYSSGRAGVAYRSRSSFGLSS